MAPSKNKIQVRDFKLMFIMGAVFATLAVGLWVKTGGIFYFYNFSIIGLSLMVGMGLWPLLPKQHKHWARRVSQVFVGGYMFFGLGMGLIYLGFGVIVPENMQMEGFWFWLLSGMSAASVIHYLIAKIAGPFLFTRGWCGWACWTVALLDFLPWKENQGRISGKWEFLRHIHFALVLIIVSLLVYQFRYDLSSTLGIVQYKEVNAAKLPVYASMWQIPELWWFLSGNIFYYAGGVLLAYRLRDNRAFCKYLCPIVTFFKIGSRWSLVKIGAKGDKCTFCGRCEKHCPMDIQLTQYIRERRRITSTECILCQTCASVCPNGVLRVDLAFDMSRGDYLRRRNVER